MRTTHLPDHDHHLDLESALEFLNTRELVGGRLVDHLERPADAVEWFVAHGVLHPGGDPWTSGDLEHVRVVRDALREVVDAVVEHRAPEPDALGRVNAAMAVGRTGRLELDGPDLRVGHAHRTDAVGSAVAALVEPVVATLGTEGPRRFRICANDTCRWSFYDTSPTARRRWCDMRTCGNRAKAARHRERVRAASALGDAPLLGDAPSI